MALIKGTREEQRLELLSRSKAALQRAQDLRVDSIACGDEVTEWTCDAAIKQHESDIALLESKAPNEIH